MTKLTRKEIEANKDVMTISKYLENKAKKNPEFITDISPTRYTRFYIPDGYEGWELKEFNGDGIGLSPILVSSDKDIVIAPYLRNDNADWTGWKELKGYSQEFLEDMKNLYLIPEGISC